MTEYELLNKKIEIVDEEVNYKDDFIIEGKLFLSNDDVVKFFINTKRGEEEFTQWGAEEKILGNITLDRVEEIFNENTHY